MLYKVKIFITLATVHLHQEALTNYTSSIYTYKKLLVFPSPQLFSLVIMSVYSNISLDSDSTVQDIKGFLIILASEILFTFVYAVFTLVFVDLPLLRKETGNRLYSLSAYYVTIVFLMVSESRSMLLTILTFYSPTDSSDYLRDAHVCIDYLFCNGYRK